MPTDTTDLHVPRRPAWSCQGCGQPWPCATYRAAALAEEHGGAGTHCLTARMGGHLAEAKWDLPDVPIAELEARFLRWTRGQGR